MTEQHDIKNNNVCLTESRLDLLKVDLKKARESYKKLLKELESCQKPLTNKERLEGHRFIQKLFEIKNKKIDVPRKFRRSRRGAALVSINQQPMEDENMKAWSFRCQEDLYRMDPSPLPYKARGLFAILDDASFLPASEPGAGEKLDDKDQIVAVNGDDALPTNKKAYRIILRGYDKFFSIGEVPATEVGYLVIRCIDDSFCLFSGLSLKKQHKVHMR
jgi:hypothetical protein